MKRKILGMLMLLVFLVGCGNAKSNESNDKKDMKSETKVEEEKKEDTSKDSPKKEESEEKKESDKKSDDKKNVAVTTSFIRDMVEVLVGEDGVNISQIIPSGDDPHLYVAKPEDYNKLADADLVLYHGIHFEGKMIDALEKDGFAIASTFKEDSIGKMEEDGKMEDDPHFWFDLNLYKEAFTNVSDKLKDLLKDDEELVKKIGENHESYIKELDDLDKYIKSRIEEIPEGSRYLITPHDAFNYFERSYGMKVMAPQGVSTDSEVSNKDLEDTAKFIADNKIKAIFTESTTNPERMEKLQEIVKSKNFEVKVVNGEGNELFSDSLAKKGEHGDTFLDMYRHNIDLIVENLK